MTDAADVAVVAIGYTLSITVQEDPSVANWPTQNFVVRKPATTADGIQRPIGGSYNFNKAGACYIPGETAGYVRLSTVSTSTTFQQDEA